METTDTIIYSGDSQFSLCIRVSEILTAKQMNKKSVKFTIQHSSCLFDHGAF